MYDPRPPSLLFEEALKQWSDSRIGSARDDESRRQETGVPRRTPWLGGPHPLTRKSISSSPTSSQATSNLGLDLRPRLRGPPRTTGGIFGRWFAIMKLFARDRTPSSMTIMRACNHLGPPCSGLRPIRGLIFAVGMKLKTAEAVRHLPKERHK